MRVHDALNRGLLHTQEATQSSILECNNFPTLVIFQGALGITINQPINHNTWDAHIKNKFLVSCHFTFSLWHFHKSSPRYCSLFSLRLMSIAEMLPSPLSGKASILTLFSKVCPPNHILNNCEKPKIIIDATPPCIKSWVEKNLKEFS